MIYIIKIIVKFIPQRYYNVLGHDYFWVDEEIIWKPCREDLLPLAPQLEDILHHLETDYLYSFASFLLN